MHRVSEGFLVGHCGPDRECILGIIATECLRVQNQKLQALRRTVIATLLEHLLDRVEKQLQCGQSLLPINHEPRHKHRRRDLLLL